MDLVCDVEPQRDQVGHFQHQMHVKDEQIHVLQRKLEHFRSWLSGLQGQLAAKDPQLLKNARRLYIGGIPDGTKEVCNMLYDCHNHRDRPLYQAKILAMQQLSWQPLTS